MSLSDRTGLPPIPAVGDVPILRRRDPVSAGLVTVVADEAGRYSRFAICISGLAVPPGTSIVWQIGNDIASARNSACRQALELAEGGHADWVWFVDDDHAFRPDVLTRLLRLDLPVVTPICLSRQQPFLAVPTALDGYRLDLRDHRPDEVVEVLHAGSSGMLIRREVLQAVEPPWFELGNGVSEDVAFCQKARAAGFGIHVDMGTRLGHMTTAVVWPVFHRGEDQQEDVGEWYTGFTVADGAQLAIDPAVVDRGGG